MASGDEGGSGGGGRGGGRWQGEGTAPARGPSRHTRLQVQSNLEIEIMLIFTLQTFLFYLSYYLLECYLYCANLE